MIQGWTINILVIRSRGRTEKSKNGQKPQRIKLKADKTIKKRKYFNTPTIKVYDPMIT